MLSVAYSPDGRRLACGSMDGTVAVFDTASGKLLHTLDGHFKPIRSLTFTPGRSSLAIEGLSACVSADVYTGMSVQYVTSFRWCHTIASCECRLEDAADGVR